MNVPLLIGAMVRQTTVLIAQLATTGGVRAPLAQVANQVFLDLVRELERQGVSRKVSADMFGMGLRTYLRKIQRLGESSTERGVSLWEAVLEYLQENSVVTRGQVLERFHRDDEAQVRGVLHDLTESGLVFCSGSGPSSAYRAATEQELGDLRRMRQGDGLDELVWAIIYREGPVTLDAIANLGGVDRDELAAAVGRLEATGRVVPEAGDDGDVAYTAPSFFVERDSPAGFEAAVFDHFQAAVKTIACRLRNDPSPLPLPPSVAERDGIGGSTYTFDLWPGHPKSDEAVRFLAEYRARMSELRTEVEAHNAAVGVPERHVQVVTYAGQCMIEQEAATQKGANEEDDG